MTIWLSLNAEQVGLQIIIIFISHHMKNNTL